MSEVTISVRGEHERRLSPEEAVARLRVHAEGPERGEVVERMSSRAFPVRQQLEERAAEGSVAEWSSQRVAIWAERPWNNEGKQLAPVHHASVEFSAVFTDFAVLSAWITDVSSADGVQIDGVDWRLSRETARSVEADVAAEAVQVAVERARAYASALGFGTVEPREIADVGMLGRPESAAPGMLRMAKASFASDGGVAPEFDLHPEDIVVTAAVEARFAAS